MKTWEDLMKRVASVEIEKYGPHTKEIGSTILALQDAPWYGRVAAPSPYDDRVVRVQSWREAWSILEPSRRDRYTAHGILIAPMEAVTGEREHARWTRDAPEDKWWRAATDLVRRSVDIEDPPELDEWDKLTRSRSSDYVTDTIDRVLEEIVFMDHVSCTYFREQLQWLAAGYFPCGWEGDWPQGRMRVY